VSYLSAYRSVLSVCSQQFIPGEIIAICTHHQYYDRYHTRSTQEKAKTHIHQTYTKQ